MNTENQEKWPQWKTTLHEVIFGTETPAGRAFDVILMISISFSVLVVFLDSVQSIRDEHGDLLYSLEWLFTILFTVEYVFRIITSRKPSSYIFSFYGIIDLLSILPTYLSLILTGGQFLIVIRIFRLLRLFRILKLGRYMRASSFLRLSIYNSRFKIAVFLWSVMVLVVIIGAVMYLVEGPENGYRNIPESIYWTIVTLTTVGYGDISPQTGLGKVIASMVMIIGSGIIAIPTGIISAEISRVRLSRAKRCRNCGEDTNPEDANFCKECGYKLH